MSNDEFLQQLKNEMPRCTFVIAENTNIDGDPTMIVLDSCNNVLASFKFDLAGEIVYHLQFEGSLTEMRELVKAFKSIFE